MILETSLIFNELTRLIAREVLLKYLSAYTTGISSKEMTEQYKMMSGKRTIKRKNTTYGNTKHKQDNRNGN
jgi:hypothetical protein